MTKYPTNEVKKIQFPQLNLDKMSNEEIVGLYLIGGISYLEMQKALDMTTEETMKFLDGLQKLMSQFILRDDEDNQVDVW